MSMSMLITHNANPVWTYNFQNPPDLNLQGIKSYNNHLNSTYNNISISNMTLNQSLNQSETWLNLLIRLLFGLVSHFIKGNEKKRTLAKGS